MDNFEVWKQRLTKQQVASLFGTERREWSSCEFCPARDFRGTDNHNVTTRECENCFMKWADAGNEQFGGQDTYAERELKSRPAELRDEVDASQDTAPDGEERKLVKRVYHDYVSEIGAEDPDYAPGHYRVVRVELSEDGTSGKVVDMCIFDTHQYEFWVHGKTPIYRRPEALVV